MGVIISKIWGPGIKYVGDTTTGLTAEEKTILADTFNVFKQDLSKSGERLFIIYFTDYPEHKKYFRDFKNKTVEELEGSPKLIAHATNVMSAINGIISLLNEPENLVELIRKTGYNHGRRNIQDQAFLDLNKVFAKLLQEKVKNCTPQILEVWEKTLKTIATVFKQGEDEYHKDKNNDN